MNELAPNVDIYGTYARASAVADFVELASLQGFVWTKAKLADYINDLSWGSKIHENFLVPNGTTDSVDEEGEGLGSDGAEAADRIFSLFVDRHTHLDNRYPFRLVSHGEQLEVLHKEPSPYLALLAITIAHSFRMDVVKKPHDVFEDTVHQAFVAAGHTSINFAQFRKSYSTFAQALTAAGPALNLRTTPMEAAISASAQDAGGDVLAHINAGYSSNGGVGAWTLVGQVTCGQSDTWKSKLGEVDEPAWKLRLGSVLRPQAFLAVPHHAERNHLRTLVTNTEQMVLDRLRLTMMLMSVSDDEQAILDHVLSAPILP